MSTENPAPGGDALDTEDKTTPPYEGRKKSGEVADKEESTKEGVKTAGATGPVSDDDQTQPDPDATEGGATGAPADEQPAAESGGDAEDEASVGPAHTKGTSRGEDVP
jgi:hypothetical protein